VQIFEITDRVYEYYKQNVKGNEDVTKDQAAKKLSRNVMLAKEIPPRNEQDISKGNKMYYYGSLHIVLKGDKIIYLNNHRGSKCYGWELDQEKYEKISTEFEITA
jgi:hypothetical protein